MKSLSFLDRFSAADRYADFHGEWKKGISSFIYYKSEEKEKLLQLGSFLGTTDMSGQLSAIALHLAFFEVFHKNAVADYEKYGKISTLLGVFFGASVFILLM